jgi:hypothetical protein
MRCCMQAALRQAMRPGARVRALERRATGHLVH